MREKFNRIEDAQEVNIEVYLDAKEYKELNPWIFSVFIKYDTYSESDGGLDNFFETKESLIITLEYETKAKYVGNRLVGDWSEIYFYAPNSKNLDVITAKILKPTAYIYESNVAKDKDWEFFEHNIFPTDLELSLMQSIKIIELLEEEGDNILIPREVEHYASFETLSQKDRFIDKVTHAGFKFKDDISIEEFDNGVALIKEHNVTIDELHKIISKLMLLIKEECGEYELWSTIIQDSNITENKL
ncbi:MAG: ribonuclease E inhibitor RraB [Sulfurimonas sp.]|nr:ribonuclease E inhibitor RraB [Sulfurimonas sp.]